MTQSDIGLIGLAVMGQNLVLNLEDNGYSVSVFNRTLSKVDQFLEGPANGKNIFGFKEISEFFSSLKRPRKVILMVKAGQAVDDFIAMCLPHMEEGDILIDGGNSHYHDSARRVKELQEKGLHFVGAGISGGEEGARFGPSIMPGGSQAAWDELRPIFQKIAARSYDDLPCCDWVGDEGAGHYVKMVHNGIEYGDMQLICESYQLMKDICQMDPDEMAKSFEKFNEGDLNSYLIEITSKILKSKDENDEWIVDSILDSAGQKGTGKWVGIHSLDIGVPASLITEAVFARFVSAQIEERKLASELLEGPSEQLSLRKDEFLEDIEQALFAAKIVSYAQGFSLIQEASKEYGWNINMKNLAVIWQGGCIIRSTLLQNIKNAFNNDPTLRNILLAPYFNSAFQKAQNSLRKVVSTAVRLGVPVPCLSNAIAYYDSYRSKRLPANLLQAQRDFFGAHGFERIDRERGEFFHHNWTGSTTNACSTPYTV